MQKIRGLFVDPDGVPSVRLDGPGGGPGSDRIVQVHYVRYETVFKPNFFYVTDQAIMIKHDRLFQHKLRTLITIATAITLADE